MPADSGKLTGMRLPVERRSSTRIWAGESSADLNHAMAVTFENSAAANRTPPVASPVQALTATDCDRTRTTAAESDRAHKDRHHGEQGVPEQRRERKEIHPDNQGHPGGDEVGSLQRGQHAGAKPGDGERAPHNQPKGATGLRVEGGPRRPVLPC